MLEPPQHASALKNWYAVELFPWLTVDYLPPPDKDAAFNRRDHGDSWIGRGLGDGWIQQCDKRNLSSRRRTFHAVPGLASPWLKTPSLKEAACMLNRVRKALLLNHTLSPRRSICSKHRLTEGL